jgi:hypothetical protein
LGFTQELGENATGFVSDVDTPVWFLVVKQWLAGARRRRARSMLFWQRAERASSFQRCRASLNNLSQLAFEAVATFHRIAQRFSALIMFAVSPARNRRIFALITLKASNT